MIYVPIDSETSLEDLRNRIEGHSFFTQSASFLDEKGLVIVGYYATEEDEIIFLEFAKTSLPNNDVKKVGIFALLKDYAVSKRFHGIMNTRGEVLVPNIYTAITFIQYGHGLFVVCKNDKFGVVNEEGRVIIPLKYDKIIDVGEVTLGLVQNGLIGFADIAGNIIINPKYVYDEYRVYEYQNGVINVEGTFAEFEERVFTFNIDHYGNILTLPEEVVEEVDDWDSDFNYPEHNLGTGYYPYGDLPSSSEAYEGDDSNRWNTD